MEKFKKILIARRKELEETLKSYKKSAAPVDLDQSTTGRLTRMDAMQQQQMVLNAKRQTEINLELVDQALKRVDANEYGICLRCEEEINEKRLMAKPEAPFCTDCQEG